MDKIYVLDTNIFLHNPHCIEKFEDNEIVVPYVVLEELDKKKTAKEPEVAYNAREAMRELKKLRKRGNLLTGVGLDNGGMLSIYVPLDRKTMEEKYEYPITLPMGWDEEKADNKILLSVLYLIQEEEYGKEIILVSNDGNMLIKADSLSIKAQEYKNDRINESIEIYKGRTTKHIKDCDFDNFLKEKELLINEDTFEEKDKYFDNEFINLLNWQGGSVLAQVNNGYLYPLYNSNKHPMGLTPKNCGQTFLMEALLTDYDSCPLTICNGPAGTGKTLFAIASGLEQVMEEKKYKSVLICRPNVTMDEEIGFLPGTEQEKISPLLRGTYDNLKVIFGNKDDTAVEIADKIKELFQRGYIEAQSIAYLRGRSITDTYIIIDECQNASPNQILSIITRAGEGSKIVLLGDVNQIDNIRLDSRNNGLVYAIERMKDSSLTQIVTFDEKECTRSKLAKEAANRLKR